MTIAISAQFLHHSRHAPFATVSAFFTAGAIYSNHFHPFPPSIFDRIFSFSKTDHRYRTAGLTLVYTIVAAAGRTAADCIFGVTLMNKIALVAKAAIPFLTASLFTNIKKEAIEFYQNAGLLGFTITGSYLALDAYIQNFHWNRFLS